MSLLLVDTQFNLPYTLAEDFTTPPRCTFDTNSFSTVYKVIERTTGNPFAVKVLDRKALAEKEREDHIVKEVEALMRCREEGKCRHIVELAGVLEDDEAVYVRLECCESSLQRLVNAMPACQASEAEVLRWAAQLLVGLADLHSMSIFHRNIDPEHLLVTTDNVVKICGFGCCSSVHESPTTPAGSSAYTSPEMSSGKVQTPAVDLWSAGSTLLRFLCGPNQKGLGQLARHGRLSEDERLHALSPACRDLLQELLRFDATERITAYDSLNHAWLKTILVFGDDDVAETLLPPSLAQTQNLEELPVPLLGAGAFAKIFTVRQRTTGETFAMKVMERSFFAVQGLEDQMMFEVEAMRQCTLQKRCRHVVHLWSAKEVSGSVFLRMEMCQTNLLHYVQEMPCGVATEANAASWSAQLFSGLADIHHVGFIHRDIKLENLLLSLDGHVKIADFGWCARFADGPTSLAGTWQTMPPEMLQDDGAAQTVAVDVWSAGCSIMQSVIGRPFVQKALEEGPTGFSATDPWAATRERQARLLRCISEACPILDEQRPSHLTPVCWNFMQCVIAREVESRATVEQALKHRWHVSLADPISILPVAPALLPTRMSKNFLQSAAPLVGEGAFAKIFKVMSWDGEVSAVKMLDRRLYSRMGLSSLVRFEFDSLRRCREETSCKNVLKMCDAIEEDGRVYIRTELCAIDLLQKASEFAGRVAPEVEVKSWATQLFAGLSEIHGLGLIHRDVKLPNLFLTDIGVLKIGDFGWCASDGSPAALAGTWHIMAPEVLQLEAHTPAVDVWSAGCCILELLLGRPYLTSCSSAPTLVTTCSTEEARDLSVQLLLAEIAEVCPLPADRRPGHVSLSCWTFLQCALTRTVSERITVAGARKEGWLRDPWASQPSERVSA
mmetsp:Transcript_56096/g.149665  ORF Transcript_56096/g.149665 Transcript_56096/m.149665 type:complete len:896 (-) Transcript_56096:419-3106(-)|eukprot:CAMPEP_0194527054 /NCGR_PEP_ID=MMETSP0253-20130528/63026_1 /TAXON_ID=2966 /ORGANISM="Noctiluca scintillans" /LENGTH=895 /DNA_ID=CAMNT_0039371935 /DNA_START=30 /DNA_END=2717 /DNA_ORIENTATION=-